MLCRFCNCFPGKKKNSEAFIEEDSNCEEMIVNFKFSSESVNYFKKNEEFEKKIKIKLDGTTYSLEIIEYLK